MHPVLFRIPMPGWELPIVGQLDSIPVYSYGFMLGLSLVVGWYLTLGLARRDGLPQATMANNYVITALAAIVMSRLLYIVTNPDEFGSPADWFSFRAGGLVAYGGFLGGFLGSWIYLRIKRIPLLPWADVAVPSLASGLAITRVGCYLFGCDYGRPLGEGAPAWLQAMGSFPHWEEGTVPTGAGSPAWLEHVRTRGLDPDAATSLPVHPTQIYEALIGAVLLAALLFLRRHQRFRGQIFFVATFAYGVGRWGIEILRDDPERGAIALGMSHHLALALSLGLFAIGWAIGPSRLVEHPTARRASQVIAFVPAVVVLVALRPQSFAAVDVATASTSQLIALSSALAVCIAYAIYDRAARLHPEAAMELGLPAAYSSTEQAAGDDEADEADAADEADEADEAGGAADPGREPEPKAEMGDEDAPPDSAREEPAAEPKRAASAKTSKKRRKKRRA
jgi:phosphatidylglycerol---prolipoprotein diacylglyceryl transferase